MNASESPLFHSGGVLVSAAPAQYSTGFENPPFVSGDISGQDSWTTNQNPSTARVLTADRDATELTNVGLNADMPVQAARRLCWFPARDPIIQRFA